MRQTLGRLAKAVELKPDAGKAQFPPESIRKQDELGVHLGTCKAKHLRANLVELPVAAALRPLVTKHRPHVVKALTTIVKHGMFNNCPDHPDNIRHFTQTAHK